MNRFAEASVSNGETSPRAPKRKWLSRAGKIGFVLIAASVALAGFGSYESSEGAADAGEILFNMAEGLAPPILVCAILEAKDRRSRLRQAQELPPAAPYEQ